VGVNHLLFNWRGLDRRVQAQDKGPSIAFYEQALEELA
jgi:hypothetical protein